MTDQPKTVSTSSFLQEHRTFPPSLEVVKRAHLNADQYQAMYERSVNAPDAFWLEQAGTLEWSRKLTLGRRFVWDTVARRI